MSELVFPKALGSLKRTGLVVGVIGAALGVAGLFVDSERFFKAYLLGYLLWLSVALGSMGLLMLHHLVGGAWGFVIQRLLEAAVRTLPLMALLFIPLAFGLHDLYHWTHADAVAQDHILQHKAPYLNIPFFLLRAAFYLLVWNALGFLLTRWSEQQEQTGNTYFTTKMHRLSGPGLVVLILTLTFASFDWGMSLDPHWFSTIYGLLFVVGSALAGMSFTILMLRVLKEQPELAEALTVDRLHDLGKLLFAFTMLWGYVNLSQYLIIWIANIPEEVTWYFHRQNGGWQVITALVVLFVFAAPFLMLMTRYTKRRLHHMVWLAGLVLVVRWLDLYWLLYPSETMHSPSLHWLDLAVPLGIGGFWVLLYGRNVTTRRTVVERDPRVQEALGHAH